MADRVNRINSAIKKLNDSINNKFESEEIDKYLHKNFGEKLDVGLQ